MELEIKSNSSLVHVLMVCFPGQGHINPFLRLAKVIASHGPLVTFSTNADAGQRMATATGTINVGTVLPVGRGHLQFQFFDDGRDRTADSFDTMMTKLETTGSAALEALIRRQADSGRPVTYIVNNPFLPWVADVAARTGIRWSLLWVQSCAVLWVYLHRARFPGTFPESAEEWASFELALPGLPPLKARDIPTFLVTPTPANDPWSKHLSRVMLSTMQKLSTASRVVVESFEELESAALSATAALLHPRLHPVGPLANLAGTAAGAIRGDLWMVDDDSCIDWLDRCPAASVLYVSLGSVVALSPEQTAEMAEGLKDSGRRFLWVVKPAGPTMDTGLPAGFEADVAGRGLVVQWSPQERVLSHPAVAGFLTHCGWNSTMETLAAGKPVVALPNFGDQPMNAKLLADVLGLGVRMSEPVTAAEVGRCVAELFEGPRAEEMRVKAAEWKELASASTVADCGSSDVNLKLFLSDIIME